MPQHSLQDRIKRAKRRGITPSLKDAELGRPVRSKHAAKKSSHKAGTAKIPDRHVSRRSPPGEGVSGRKRVVDERAAYRAENAASGGGRGRRYHVSEPHQRRTTTVRGRKKAPSAMGVKHKGGPRKRSRLHGG